MKDSELIRGLAGNDISEEKLACTDCYVRPSLGLFIPVSDSSFLTEKRSFPSYLAAISFEQAADSTVHYSCRIISPDVVCTCDEGRHYYFILISKEFFEKRYLMYSDTLPSFKDKDFEMCSDILKALNTFAFEYSKGMMNSHITLDAQCEIITHWIIRSLFGETLDMRAVSADYSVARAQHYMEQHYGENITVAKLAELGYVSPSSLNRRFKKETGITPIEYLIEIRLAKAKLLLRRKNISVTEIAMRCGFGSSAHFSACFQSRTGISPSDYREKYSD
ncbi:MAG: helix-turn-helix transcriptional regulator [Oscillospiraceae bacterium]|nr:helix-turn-helix transcriptional regulator [Oscillospiraceae bacterium]